MCIAIVLILLYYATDGLKYLSIIPMQMEKSVYCFALHFVHYSVCVCRKILCILCKKSMADNGELCYNIHINVRAKRRYIWI